jgi:hypothetical protein
MTGPSWPKRGSSGHCAEQGVPVKIRDPLVLDKIAKILRPDTDQDSGGR